MTPRWLMSTCRILVNQDSEQLRGKLPATYAFIVEVDGAFVDAGRSHQPFLDGCRILMARGVDPEANAVMVWTPAGTESLHGRVGKAAGLMVVEDTAGTGLRFAPFREYTGPPEDRGQD